MAEKRACCCSVLPKGLWWLFSILGMLLLSVMMLSSRQGMVENDIKTRTLQSLVDNNQGWAEVKLDQRGRDVLLTGRAPTEAIRDQAIAIAKDVEGVRIVDDEIVIKPLDSPLLDIKKSAEGVTLAGVMPGQQMIDALLDVTQQTFGDDKVKNQMTVSDEVGKPEWLAAAVRLIPELSKLDAGALQVSDNNRKLSGVLHNEGAKQALLAKAKGAFGAEVADNVSVKSLEPSAFNMSLEDGKIRLQGLVSIDEEMAALVNAASDKVGADHVINELAISADVGPAPWATAMGGLMGSVVDGGSLALKDGVLQLTGMVDSEDTRSAMVKQFNDALAANGLQVDDQLEVVEPEPVAEPEPAVVETSPTAEPPVVETETTSPDETEAAPVEVAQEPAPTPEPEVSEEEKARLACQSKLDDALKGSTIVFATNSARISTESFPLLDTLATDIKDCTDIIADKGVEIGGHTDSRGNDIYNMDLSQRRADSVKSYLLKKGIKEAMLTAIGYGETRPIASEDSAEGLERNRRITFEIKQN